MLYVLQSVILFFLTDSQETEQEEVSQETRSGDHFDSQGIFNTYYICTSKREGMYSCLEYECYMRTPKNNY